jgi:hypothetical protein
MSKADFIKIDKNAVIDFAKACKLAGIQYLLAYLHSIPMIEPQKLNLLV